MKWDAGGYRASYRQGGGVVFAHSKRRKTFAFFVVLKEGAERDRNLGGSFGPLCSCSEFPPSCRNAWISLGTGGIVSTNSLLAIGEMGLHAPRILDARILGYLLD